jgi:hypothetical protein
MAPTVINPLSLAAEYLCVSQKLKSQKRSHCCLHIYFPKLLNGRSRGCTAYSHSPANIVGLNPEGKVDVFQL